MAFPLTDEQKRVVEHSGSALLVSAAAGSGKTRVLVERLLHRVEQGEDIDRFLVITFTNAAAAELRERIGTELTARLAADPDNAHLRRQSLRLYQARICTIDALCLDLLHQYGNLLDLDPDFRICDAAEGEKMARDVLDELLDTCYEEMDEGFSALAEYAVRGRDDGRLAEMVLDIHGKLQSCADPEQWLLDHRNDMRAAGVRDAGSTLWGAMILDHVRAQAAYWRGRMIKAAELAAADETVEKGYGECIRDTVRRLDELASAESWDAARACLPVDFGRAKPVRKAKDTGGDTVRDAVLGIRKKCMKAMGKLEDMVGGDSETVLGELRQLSPVMEALLDLTARFEEELMREKNRRSVLEFSDAEHLTVRLLKQEPMRALLREQFSEIMVDEYQDTNEVQNSLFEAMSDGGNNLFFVGDVKQSIYRFRNADPTIFLALYRSWKSPEDPDEAEGRKLLLSRNFRSVPQVLAAVNDVFSLIMSYDCGEMEYGDEERLCWDPDAPEDPAYGVEMDVLDVSYEDKEQEALNPPALVEARFVARRLRQMLDERFPVSDGKGGLRPMEAGDAVILLRSPGPVMRHYIRALGEEGIETDTQEGGDFFETTEISTALALLRVIDNPHRDVPLIALLRSPLFRFSSDRLAEIRSAAEEGDFYDALLRDGGDDCEEFLEQLRRLRARAGEMSVHRLLERLYRETHMTAVFGAMPDGLRRQANLRVLSEEARQEEAAGRRGLFSFLQHIECLQEQGKDVEVPRGNGGVKILSIHRAKGLEFPVVFLSGLAREFNTRDMQSPMLFHARLGLGPMWSERGDGWTVEWPTAARRAVTLAMDREDKAEEMRLLYVAMTRAREKLIMTMSMKNWEKKRTALAGEADCPPDPEVVAEKKSMGEWLLLSAMTRPEAEILRQGNDCPVYLDGRGPEWDIRVVKSAAYIRDIPRRTARNRDRSAADEERSRSLEAALGYRYPELYAAQIPSCLTATQLKGRYLDREAAEGADVPAVPREHAFDRPDFAAESMGLTATQRGTAVHRVLQYMSFDRTGSPEEIAGEIRRLAAGEFISEQEAACADPGQLYAFFSSELGRQLLAAPERHREYQFYILLPAGDFYPEAEGDPEEQILFQGVVDCWFETEEGVTVVDFKTDRIPEPEQYRAQVESYAGALEMLIQKKVVRKALYFLATGQTVYM